MGDDPQSARTVKIAESLPNANDKWYCRVDRIEYGPFRSHFLREMIAYGRMPLKAKDFVKVGHEGSWERAEKFSDIMAAIEYFERSAQAPDLNDNRETRSTLASSLSNRVSEAILGSWERFCELLAWRPAGISWSDFAWVFAPFNALAEGARFVSALCSSIGVSVTGLTWMSLWIAVNALALCFPDKVEELGKFVLKSMVSPTTWFLLFALGAYVAAVRVKLKG